MNHFGIQVSSLAGLLLEPKSALGISISEWLLISISAECPNQCNKGCETLARAGWGRGRGSGIVSSWINTRVISLGADPFFAVWECLMFILLGESLIQRTLKRYTFFSLNLS